MPFNPNAVMTVCWLIAFIGTILSWYSWMWPIQEGRQAQDIRRGVHLAGTLAQAFLAVTLLPVMAILFSIALRATMPTVPEASLNVWANGLATLVTIAWIGCVLPRLWREQAEHGSTT